MAVVRVLLVTDDWFGVVNGGFLQWGDQPMPAAVGKNSREFHLGEFVRVLQDTAWVGFDVELTKAHRSPAGTGGLNEAALKAERGADVVGFRFDEPFTVNGQSRTLSDYDMALFFPINAGNPNPAFASEAEAIAQYMEDGGGFFATGDHANLGSELAGLIPRVRSMRRWWVGPGGGPQAPPATSADRHDTTRPGLDGVVQFEDQSDQVAQEIDPALHFAGLAVSGGYPAKRFFPHPLLCSPDGMVKHLPDHMHEGWCEVPSNPGSRTFVLNGTNVREYPDYTPPDPSSGGAAPLEPVVVAYGHVVAGMTSPALDDVHTGGEVAALGKTFGVIGAWDGHLVGKGRVVVDSTWHHFFNINLTGDRYLENEALSAAHWQKLFGFFVPDGDGPRVPNGHYREIMWYFRNIIYWLIPADRHQGIWWATLAQVTKRPQLLEELDVSGGLDAIRELTFEHYLHYGHLAETYLTQARGSCAVFQVHRYIYKSKIPWWEWIQVEVDIWNPRVDRRANRGRTHQLVGALGAGPRFDVGRTLALGAAVVAAAAAQRGTVATRSRDAEPEAWAEVLDHALGAFAEKLSVGADAARSLERVLDAQLGESSASAVPADDGLVGV